MSSVVPNRRLPYGVIAVVMALCLGAMLRGAALSTPRYLDDHAQLAMLEGTWPDHRGPFDLFAFVRAGERDGLAEVGILPWWTSTRFVFVMGRPLASALIVLDHGFFGRGLRGPHLHSLLWWAAAVVAAARLYRKVLSPRVAALAVVLYAVDEAHTMPIAWLANRSVLVATAFGLLGVLAHIRWRMCIPGARWHPIAGFFFAAALAGEYAACTLGYVLAWELVVSRDGLRARALACLPALTPVVGAFVAYRLAGCGVAGSSQYLDPLRAPMTLMFTAATRVPTLLADQLCALSADAPSLVGFFLGGNTRVGVVAAGIGALALVVRTRTLDADARSNIAWLAVGGLFALAPVAASIPSSRLLVASGVGFSGALAVLIDGVWATAASPRPRDFTDIVAWPVYLAATVIHLGIAPWRTHTESTLVATLLTREHAAIVRSAPPRGTDRVIALAVADPETLHYAPAVWREAGRPAPTHWAVLSMTLGPMLLVRPDAFTLEVRALGVPFLSGAMETMYIAPGETFGEGDESDGAGFVATVEVSEGGFPRQLRFRFDHELDAPGTVVVVATARGLTRVPLPGIHGGIAVPTPVLPGL